MVGWLSIGLCVWFYKSRGPDGDLSQRSRVRGEKRTRIDHITMSLNSATCAAMQRHPELVQEFGHPTHHPCRREGPVPGVVEYTLDTRILMARYLTRLLT